MRFRLGRPSIKRNAKEIKGRKFIFMYYPSKHEVKLTLCDNKGFTTGTDVLHIRIRKSDAISEWLFPFLDKLAAYQDKKRTQGPL